VTNPQRQLERAALAAHTAGHPWATFWQHHGDEVAAAEPFDRQKYRRLVDRLLGLVVAGDVDGAEPPDAQAPWEIDNKNAKPADTGTQARFDWGAIGEPVR
jgi:hypothetical protein